MSVVWPVVTGLMSLVPGLLLWHRVRQLENLSYRDYQTGLRNGRLVDDDLALLGRTHTPIALLLIDLDHFGRHNDFGYRERGDQALLVAAQTIRRTLRRRADRIYRMHTAGDEFLVLLSPRDYAHAFHDAELVRLALEQAGVPASIGVAYLTNQAPGAHGPVTDALLETATLNKSIAKRNGRNRVYPPSDGQPHIFVEGTLCTT